jgi:hypothetical protein
VLFIAHFIRKYHAKYQVVDIIIDRKSFVGFKGGKNDNYSYFVTNIAIFVPRILSDTTNKQEKNLVEDQEEIQRKYHIKKEISFDFSKQDKIFVH